MNDKETVAAVVWPWRQAQAGGAEAEARRHPLALVEALVMTGVGALILFKFHHRWPAWILFALAVFVAVSGMCMPGAYRAFKRGGQRLGRAAGVASAWLLLVPFFYICFPAGRLFFRLAGKDPLARHFDPRLKSYWHPRPPAADAARYRSQS